MIKEIWVDAYGSNGRYQVSNLGGFKSFHPRFYNQIGKPRVPKSPRGRYPWIVMYLEDKNIKKTLHRVIWESFKGPIPKGLEINHLDGVKTNSCLSNLELVTPSQNQIHAYKTGLKKITTGTKHWNSVFSNKDILKIKDLLKNGMSQGKISKMYGCNQSSISDIATGKRHLARCD